MSFKTILFTLSSLLIISILCEENLTITDTHENEAVNSVTSKEKSETNKELELEKFEFDEFAKKLMEEMQITKEKDINKETFRRFIHRLITRDEQLESNETELYNELIERIVKTAPEVIEVSTISKYIEQDVLLNSLNELIKERYGEEALNNFNQEFNPDL